MSNTNRIERARKIIAAGEFDLQADINTGVCPAASLKLSNIERAHLLQSQTDWSREYVDAMVLVFAFEDTP